MAHLWGVGAASGNPHKQREGMLTPHRRQLSADSNRTKQCEVSMLSAGPPHHPGSIIYHKLDLFSYDHTSFVAFADCSTNILKNTDRKCVFSSEVPRQQNQETKGILETLKKKKDLSQIFCGSACLTIFRLQKRPSWQQRTFSINGQVIHSTNIICLARQVSYTTVTVVNTSK